MSAPSQYYQAPVSLPPSISQCLFLSLDQFEDEALFEALNFQDDPNTFFLSGDIPNDAEFTEEQTTAIMANYNQVRKYLHTKKLGRGFFKGQGEGKGKGKGKQQPRRWSREQLIARTKCARCGQVGHWARTCTNEPDARGKQAAQSRNHFQIATPDGSFSGFPIASICPTSSVWKCLLGSLWCIQGPSTELLEPKLSRNLSLL